MPDPHALLRDVFGFEDFRLGQGEIVKVDTRTGEYVGRVKE